MVVSRSIVPPYSLCVKLSKGDKITGKIPTEGYIVQSKNLFDALGISYSYAYTKSPGSAARKFRNLVISLKIWVVVPESRMAEFFRGY